MVLPPFEGALAPDPSGIPASSRGKVEPLREIPGLRKKERTWKDEVRERIRDRRHRLDKDAELPLFREPEETAPKPSSLDAPPVEEPPQVELAPRDEEGPGERGAVGQQARVGFRGARRSRPLPDNDRPAVVAAESPIPTTTDDVGDLLGRPPGNEQSASRIHFGEREGGQGGATQHPPAQNEAPLDLEIRPAEATTLDEGEPVVAVPAAEPHEPEPDRVDNEGEWLLEPARPREEPRRLERPATLFDRIKAAAIDLTLLSVLWAIVVYFTGRTARVSVWGLSPGAGYLLGFLALLGLVYAGYFTGTTGQTLGKIVCRLRVVDAAGQPPGCLRAFFRSALADIGIVLACVAMLPVFFDPARRALHDRIFRTRVVRF